MIDVALAVYDPKGNYSRHAGVVIASILHKTNSAVRFHILHDETLTNENRQKLEAAYAMNAKSTNGDVSFVDVSSFLNHYYDEKLERFLGIYSKGSIFRLTIPELLSDIDRVVYLDCDIVVNLDIAELWGEFNDREKFSLIGWREMGDWPEPNLKCPKEKIYTDAYGLSRGRYINTGVLLLNLEKIRSLYKDKESLFKRGVSYILERKPEYPDQDFLNAEFLGDIGYIDMKYNEVPVDDYDDVFNCERIWHFYTRGKPWEVVRDCNADIVYWENFMRTPWHDELPSSLYKAAVNGEFYHRHSRGCFKRLWKQTVNNIKNIGRIKLKMTFKKELAEYMKEFEK